jgi:hypothetical protein
VRTSGRNAGKAKTYTDGGSDEEEEDDGWMEAPVLPGFKAGARTRCHFSST